jgi:hypothetical protein
MKSHGKARGHLWPAATAALRLVPTPLWAAIREKEEKKPRNDQARYNGDVALPSARMG